MMFINYPYLKDSFFLKKVFTQKTRKEFIKMTILDWHENPIQEIQAFSTGGNLSLNGQSSMRRSCSLTCRIDPNQADITNVENLFSINKKLFLEKGIENKTQEYQDYPILWFPQGIFVITSNSLSRSANGINLSLQLKDKMCLLNGECGGLITSSVQFDEYDTVDTKGQMVIEKPVLSRIIKEAVNHLGGEDLNRIIINDLDDKVKTVMKWIGRTPIYLVNDNGNYYMTTNFTSIQGKDYKSFQYGEDIGFIYSDFTYPKELIEQPGSNVTSVLEKIKKILSNYEYYYDIYGNFIFQETKNFINTTKATVDINNLNQRQYIKSINKNLSRYDFLDSYLVASYSNTPSFNLVKNDFVVWGTKKTTLGNSIPIRYHLAIDKKPNINNIYQLCLYQDPLDNLYKLKKPISFNNLTDLQAVNGVEGFLYYTLDNSKIYRWEKGQYVETTLQLEKFKTTDWRSELYIQGIIAEATGVQSNYYYAELAAEWPKIYDFKKEQITEGQDIIYLGGFKDEFIKDPSQLDYFLDFIDTTGKINQLSVNSIGRRSIVENSQDINCVFEPEIPDFILIEKDQPDTKEKREEAEKRHQRYIQVDSEIYNLLAVGGTLNGAFTRIKDLLYYHTSYNESVQLQILPIYDLEPNTLMYAKDIESNIEGLYLIKNISIPLDISGTMSISGSKNIEKM